LKDFNKTETQTVWINLF